jgi:guanylate kinase
MIEQMPPLPTHRGFMVILSSPSGAGKTTVARHVLSSERGLELSISMTTRPQRSSEVDGKDYHFVDEATFTKRVKEGYFLEHALVYGYHYGTPKASLEKHLEAGTDILFDIDWQGTQQLKQISTANLVSIFLLPPTFGTLEARLRNRAEDGEETIRLRMSKASDELSHWAEYDYVIINNELEESVRAVRSIVQAERLKRRRQLDLADFVNSLRGEFS